jgi:hypothetical protein
MAKAKRKKVVAKRTKKRPARAPKKRAARTPKSGSARAPARAVRALVAGQLPPPIYGVPREQVGNTVQRFIEWDGVSELSVLEEALGTFQITPLA